MRMSTSLLRLSATGLAACSLLACGGRATQGQTSNTAESVISAEKCRTQIAAKQDQLRGDGVDFSNWSFHDAPGMAVPSLTDRQTTTTFKQYDGKYRSLDNHPGCSTANLYYDKNNVDKGIKGQTPDYDGNNDSKWTGDPVYGGPNAAKGFIDGNLARIDGYPCAAKEYTQGDEDTSKPIVILVHGNSTRPHTWEKFLLPPGTGINSTLEKVSFTADTQARPQLAESLIAAHYRVLAVDFRTDLIFGVEPTANGTTENSAGNIDHGWAVPILQSLVKAVMKNNPGRKVALVGHSLGVTVVRDALRRLYVEYADGQAGAINPYAQMSHVILGSGANHGVSTFEAQLCTNNPTMRGTIVCEMGSRANYVQTEFHKPLNGPKDLYATPCADGDYAFGKTGQCGGNVVKYLNITMTDITQGANYQDYYVSEASSHIDMPGCVDNKLTTLNDYDTSGYFNKGFIANHFGSLRSDAGLRLAMDFLAQ